MRFTHCITRLFVMAMVAVATISCITEESVSNEEREKISLEAWIKLNKPELLANYQEEGGYYVEILDGDMEEYEELLFDELNASIKDWGLRAKRFKLISIVPRKK